MPNLPQHFSFNIHTPKYHLTHNSQSTFFWDPTYLIKTQSKTINKKLHDLSKAIRGIRVIMPSRRYSYVANKKRTLWRYAHFQILGVGGALLNMLTYQRTLQRANVFSKLTKHTLPLTASWATVQEKKFWKLLFVATVVFFKTFFAKPYK